MFLFEILKNSYSNRKISKFTPEQITELQSQKFSQLVQYVEQKSPYYREIIKKNKIISTKCTPDDFPILSKNDVIEHFDQIVTDKRITKDKIARFLEQSHDSNELFLNKFYVIHTSGSSGTIGFYLYTEKEILLGLSPLTLVGGVKPLQKLAYIAAAKGHFAGITMANITKKLPFIYQKVQTFDINLPFDQIIKSINTLQPTNISGYSLALKKLAEAQREGILHIQPKIIQSGGEPLTGRDKQYIQETFAASVTNVYASSEHIVMGIGNDEFNGMYLMENNLIFDIQPTYALVTNLYNYTLPLIRYQMSDRLQIIEDHTHTLPFKKIAEVVGRNEQIPIFLNNQGKEDFISPILIAEFFVKNLKQFQMHIKGNQQFIFKVCLEKDLSEKEIKETRENIEQNLKALLKEKDMTNVQYVIETVDHLPVDPKTGKFKLIVKN